MNSWLAHVHVFDVVEDERAGRAVAHHLLVDLVAVGREQRPPVALVQAVRRHGVGLGEIQGDHSGCSRGLGNIKTRVAFQHKLLILKRNFCFDVNNT